VTLAFAMAYYRWGGWRRARIVEAVPHGDVPDVGLSPPAGVEETEVSAEAAEREAAQLETSGRRAEASPLR
jgi:hypothetical protein